MDFKPTLLCFLLFASSVSCWAQGQNTDPIVTDRPGKSNGTQVLTKGSFQIEVGGGNSQASGVVSLYSGLVARIGLPWFEVRVGPGWSWSVNNSLAGGDNTQHQVSNLIEAKIALWNGERFHSALMPSFHLGYLPDNLAFGGIFVADYELADRWTLLTNLGVKAGPTTPLEYGYTLNLSTGITDSFAGFVELFGSGGVEGLPSLEWDAGFTYLVTPSLQLDLSGGYSPWANSGFVELGVSYRFSGR